LLLALQCETTPRPPHGRGRPRHRRFTLHVAWRCFPSRHPAQAPRMTAVRLSVRPLFPSPCGQPVGRAVVGGRGLRPSGVPETSGRAAVSRPVSTALRRQGRVVARAAGPRHHRPRLRHERHRRGAASAASRPPQARARVVTKVPQSAQPPADRSVQRLIQRRRCTAPAHGWAARRRSCPPSVRQRARTVAAPCHTSSPPEGLQRQAPAPLRSARAADSCHPTTTSRGLCGSRTLLPVKQLYRSCHWSSAAVPPFL